MAYDCDLDELADIVIPCDTPQGMERSAYLLTRENYLKATKTFGSTNTNILKTLVLPNGEQAYKVELLKGQLTRAVAGAAGDDMRTNFVPSIEIKIPNTPQGNRIVQTIANNEFVIIVEQKAKSTNNLAAFEVHGTQGGLVGTPVIESPNNEWTTTLSNMDSSPEKAPHLFFTTNESTDSYAADVAYLEALLTPAS